MARRRRLTLSVEAPSPPPGPALETRAMGFGPSPAAPPIARVAAEAAASAALGEMAAAWTQARDSGRMIQELPLDAIDEGWLVRDRLALDADEIADLTRSIRERGQQVPIEVVALDGGRFGLISGWRRLRALKGLHSEPGGEAFARVLAVLRRPGNAAEAYRAMVEENEIRAGLSYYERARIALRATEAGAFADPRAAISALFAAGSRAKRSKIGSFLTLVAALDDRLCFAWTIPERLGLDLARALDGDPALAGRLRERLRKSTPASPEAELALLSRALGAQPGGTGGASADDAGAGMARTRPGAADRRASLQAQEIRPGLRLETSDGTGGPRLTLSGPAVDGALRERLLAWLREGW